MKFPWLKKSKSIERDKDQLYLRRVRRAKDSRDVLPGDLLRTMAADIETGQIPCDGLVLVAIYRPKEKAWEQNTYRCNMTYDQEMVALEIAKDRCMARWFNK